MYRSQWSHNSQSDFVNCTPSRTVSCFFINCIAVNCGTPSSLSNGQRRYSSTTFGYTVTYTCNSGYLRTAGSSSRTCQSDGRWSGSHPTCTRRSTLYHVSYHTDYKHAKELLVFLVYTIILSISKTSFCGSPYIVFILRSLYGFMLRKYIQCKLQ